MISYDAYGYSPFAFQLFDLVVEDVQYISFPMSCQRDNRPFTSAASNDSTDQHTDYVTMFNVVIAMVRESAMRRVRGSQRASRRPRQPVPGVDPVAEVMGLGNLHGGISVATVCR